jgi:23S rRNA U2552 (ribose-2'-O)-methylase RlmE/FtsJ
MGILASQYDMYGITLMKEDSKSVPSWKKTAYFLEQHPHMHILTGRDGTGDLYNIDNIFATAVEMATGQKASVITGDGGFDFSTDFNQQESMSFPLLYCQTMTALLCQKPGGMFVLKFFDTYQTKTLQLLCLLRRCYRQLSFVKPYTSRPANSEKYLVCVDFRNNITVKDIVVFLQDIPKIGSSPAHHPQLALSKENTADTAFYDAIDQMNKCLFARQKEFILSTLELEKTLDDDQKRKEALFKQQIYTSTQWCHRYGIRLNYQSKYLMSSTSSSRNEPRVL